MLGWIVGSAVNIVISAILPLALLAGGAWYVKRKFFPSRYAPVSTSTGGHPMGGFLKSFIGVQGKALAQHITESLVTLDPKAASAAQLEVMEKDLNAAGNLLMQTRADHTREVVEAQAAQRRFDESLAAAENLKGKIKLAATPELAKPFQDALGRLVDHLETQKGDLDREKADVEQAAALLTEVEAAYKEKADALLHAKQDLERAQREMGRSEIERQRADQRAEAVAKVNGLRGTDTTGLTTAIDAMKNRAAANRQAAGAATEKAKVLTTGTADDAIIAQAMKDSKPSVAGKTAEERLAALSN